VIAGIERHAIHIDASKQNITFGDIDMSRKTYTAKDSPGAVLGDHFNSHVSTNVSIEGVQHVDSLIQRIAHVAQGQDRAELLSRLDEIRAYLKDGSVSKEKAKSAYTDLFARIGKYASSARDIVELVASLHRYL